jgi:hypothetical protein
VVTARILVEPGGREDPIVPSCATPPSAAPTGCPARRWALPRRRLGAAREAFTEVGGFSERLWLGGEEELMAGDLAAAGLGAVLPARADGAPPGVQGA